MGPNLALCTGCYPFNGPGGRTFPPARPQAALVQRHTGPPHTSHFQAPLKVLLQQWTPQIDFRQVVSFAGTLNKFRDLTVETVKFCRSFQKHLAGPRPSDFLSVYRCFRESLQVLNPGNCGSQNRPSSQAKFGSAPPTQGFPKSPVAGLEPAPPGASLGMCDDDSGATVTPVV